MSSGSARRRDEAAHGWREPCRFGGKSARLMTQNDLDKGRLICLIGVAIIKPAEFVIFRIGHKTADARA